jgi:hypothetical protein
VVTVVSNILLFQYFQSQNKVPNIPIFCVCVFSISFLTIHEYLLLLKEVFYQILRVGYDSGLIACAVYYFTSPCHNEKPYLMHVDLNLNTEIIDISSNAFHPRDAFFSSII